MLLSLDEAIKQFEYDAECNRVDLDLSYAENNEQVAEWLKELKVYQQQHLELCEKYDVNTIEDLYDKAIDDFTDKFISLCDDGVFMAQLNEFSATTILELAEQLKAGKENDKL